MKKQKSNLIQLKSLSSTLAIKDVDMTSRRVKGYLAGFGNKDSDDDIILKGAFAKSLSENGVNSTSNRRIAHLYQHNMSRIIGVFEELKEDDLGLYFVSKMLETSEGNDRLIEYQSGALREHSIGFKYIWDKVEYDDEQDAYIIKEVKLYEGSAVTFGANENTPYLGTFKNNESKEQILERLNQDFASNIEITKGKASDEAVKAAYYRIELIQKAYNDVINTPNVKADLITLKECEPLQIENEKPKIKSFYQLLNQQM
jgi:hypothetical protein